MKYTVSLKENHLFRRIYARGRSASSPALVVYARGNALRGNRLGLTVSTKVGKAVVRNRVRRRLREIYRLHEGELLRGRDIIVVARVRAAHTPYRKLDEQFMRLCASLSLLKTPKPKEGGAP